MHPDLQPSSLPSSQLPLISPLPHIHFYYISLEKRASLPVISTDMALKKYNKTRKKLSYQGWTKQYNMKKKVSQASKKSQRYPTTIIRSSTKPPS